MAIVDVRQSFYHTKSATAGTNTITVNLPQAIMGRQQVKDLKISMGNADAARGNIYAYLYDSETAKIRDVFIHQCQVSLHYVFHESEGIFVPEGRALKLRFGFENCVAGDVLEAVLSYTIRRFT